MLEDRLVRDLRAQAEDITPSSVPRLRLPELAGEQTRRVRRRGAAHRRWPRFAPVAAAAAVVAMAAATVAISGSLSGHRPISGTLSGHRPDHRPGQRGPFSGVPAYYVALTAKNPDLKSASAPRQLAEVRATATGAVLAVVTPPKPYSTFSAASAGDDHTFVLEANSLKIEHDNGGTLIRATATAFFLLRIGPDGRVRQLTRLAIPAEPAGALLSGFALSHDGSKLAVALRGGINGGPGPEIRVISLSTGAERVWTWPGGGPITNNAGGNGEVLSWTADGRTLAFQQWVGNDIDVRLLDATNPGGSLRSASRLAVQWKDDAETFHFEHGRANNVVFGYSAVITGDGTKIVAATASETKHPLHSELAFTEFSASTGQVVKVLGRWALPGLYPGQTQDVLWANSSGSALIVLAHVPGPAVKLSHSTNVAGYRIEFGVQRGDQFTPLPGAPRPGPNAWPTW